VHDAQDSSSFILLHEQSKVFKIIYTNCPGKRPLPTDNTEFERGLSAQCTHFIFVKVSHWDNNGRHCCAERQTATNFKSDFQHRQRVSAATGKLHWGKRTTPSTYR